MRETLPFITKDQLATHYYSGKKKKKWQLIIRPK